MQKIKQFVTLNVLFFLLLKLHFHISFCFFIRYQWEQYNLHKCKNVIIIFVIHKVSAS